MSSMMLMLTIMMIVLMFHVDDDDDDDERSGIRCTGESGHPVHQRAKIPCTGEALTGLKHALLKDSELLGVPRA